LIAGGGLVIELLQHLSKAVQLRLGRLGEIEINRLPYKLKGGYECVVESEVGVRPTLRVSTCHNSTLEPDRKRSPQARGDALGRVHILRHGGQAAAPDVRCVQWPSIEKC
jgi:hypothetical protein